MNRFSPDNFPSPPRRRSQAPRIIPVSEFRQRPAPAATDMIHASSAILFISVAFAIGIALGVVLMSWIGRAG